MRVHFIAIGGSAMHNLAIALKIKGFEVTGSDDEIFDPAKGRLAKYGILPDDIGWHPEKITPELDAVILGMHAREDNPELLKAKELGLRIYSYPEYLYEQSKDKIRVVVGGSHGKTTITSMIIHVLQHQHVECDYMVGAQLEGFEVMVRLSDTAKVMVIEGDEYLTSPIDRRPKFHVYQPTVGIISGIAWDHINVFPTFENYVEQFEIFAKMIPADGQLIYCQEDEELRKLGDRITSTTRKPYGVHPYYIRDWPATPWGSPTNNSMKPSSPSKARPNVSNWWPKPTNAPYIKTSRTHRPSSRPPSTPCANSIPAANWWPAWSCTPSAV